MTNNGSLLYRDIIEDAPTISLPILFGERAGGLE
jgi:hypothetical protein